MEVKSDCGYRTLTESGGVGILSAGRVEQTAEDGGILGRWRDTWRKPGGGVQMLDGCTAMMGITRAREEDWRQCFASTGGTLWIQKKMQRRDPVDEKGWDAIMHTTRQKMTKSTLTITMVLVSPHHRTTPSAWTHSRTLQADECSKPSQHPERHLTRTQRERQEHQETYLSVRVDVCVSTSPTSLVPDSVTSPGPFYLLCFEEGPGHRRWCSAKSSVRSWWCFHNVDVIASPVCSQRMSQNNGSLEA